MAVLEGKIDPKYCSLPDLHYIRMYASTNLDDPVYEEIARFLIEERKDRSIVYIPKTKEEAFALLQIHTIEPLPKADDWFSPS